MKKEGRRKREEREGGREVEGELEKEKGKEREKRNGGTEGERERRRWKEN